MAQSYNTKIVTAFFAECGIPTPAYEVFFHPDRKWRFDIAWPEYNVAIEVEGGVWSGGRHTRASGFVKDMEKYNEAAARGWKVLRCQPNDLCTVAFTDIIKRTMES